ncbi:UDP-N-acetylglucosamine:LPS N-acetylglucosamine transferase fused to PHP family phosphoesterase (fragment) [Methylacidimicrobium sp. AP8]
MLRQAYLAAINRTPLLWKGIYSFFDRTTVLEDGISALARMQRSLDWLLREVQPDAVLWTAVTLRAAGVEESRIQVSGFPVHLDFPEGQEIGLADELEGDPRILYIINSGKKKATKIIRLLLHHPRWRATVVVGRDLGLSSTFVQRGTREARSSPTLRSSAPWRLPPSRGVRRWSWLGPPGREGPRADAAPGPHRSRGWPPIAGSSGAGCKSWR